jgi:chemotaxis signal transduction protein
MDYQKQKEHQHQREKMDEVRRHRKLPESRAHKINRLSKDPVAVDTANQKVLNVNKAAQKLFRAIEDLSNDKDVWPLGFDQTADLFESKVNIPNAVGKKLLGLARLRNELGDRWLIDDYKALELLSQLGHEDLRNTTLRIIHERDQEPTLGRIIKTIKEIHVKGLTQLRIPKTTLDKFIHNKYVKLTRPTEEDRLVLGSDLNIHQQFEDLVSPMSEDTPGPKGFEWIEPKEKVSSEKTKPKAKRRLRKRKT